MDFGMVPLADEIHALMEPLLPQESTRHSENYGDAAGSNGNGNGFGATGPALALGMPDPAEVQRQMKKSVVLQKRLHQSQQAPQRKPGSHLNPALGRQLRRQGRAPAPAPAPQPKSSLVPVELVDKIDKGITVLLHLSIL